MRSIRYRRGTRRYRHSNKNKIKYLKMYCPINRDIPLAYRGSYSNSKVIETEHGTFVAKYMPMIKVKPPKFDISFQKYIFIRPDGSEVNAFDLFSKESI